MYVINKETNEEYTFILFEKWWQYFLLYFAYYGKKKMYKIKKPLVRKPLKQLSMGEWAIVFLLTNIITSVGIIVLIEPFKSNLLIGIGIAYLTFLLGTIIFWKLCISKEYKKVKSEEYAIISIRFFKWKTIKEMLLGTIILLVFGFALKNGFEMVGIDFKMITFLSAAAYLFPVIIIRTGIEMELYLENGNAIEIVGWRNMVKKKDSWKIANIDWEASNLDKE